MYPCGACVIVISSIFFCNYCTYFARISSRVNRAKIMFFQASLAMATLTACLIDIYLFFIIFTCASLYATTTTYHLSIVQTILFLCLPKSHGHELMGMRNSLFLHFIASVSFQIFLNDGNYGFHTQLKI